MSSIEYRDSKAITLEDVLLLYRANQWSSADKPDQLYPALLNSHSLITAWSEQQLVGLANTISDGHLVVYYPHVVVHPDFHRQGIGLEMVSRLMKRYAGFHQHAVLADAEVVGFYERCGFTLSPCPGMWIYDGDDH